MRSTNDIQRCLIKAGRPDLAKAVIKAHRAQAADSSVDPDMLLNILYPLEKTITALVKTAQGAKRSGHGVPLPPGFSKRLKGMMDTLLVGVEGKKAKARTVKAGGEQMPEGPEAELRYSLTRSTIDHLANLQPGRTLTPTTREHLEVQVKDLVNMLQRLSPEAQAKAKSLMGNAKGFLKTAAQFMSTRDRIDKAALQLGAEIKKTIQQAQRRA